MSVLLDTHIWVWWLTPDARLPAAERAALDLPLDLDVVLALDELPASFHGDPADRLIAATARAHALPLATHDSTIRKSRVARLWRP